LLPLGGLFPGAGLAGAVAEGIVTDLRAIAVAVDAGTGELEAGGTVSSHFSETMFSILALF